MTAQLPSVTPYNETHSLLSISFFGAVSHRQTHERTSALPSGIVTKTEEITTFDIQSVEIKLI